MAAGAASVRRPSTLATAPCPFAAALVVVESTERTSVDGVIVTGVATRVDVGGALAGEVERVDDVLGDVVTGDGAGVAGVACFVVAAVALITVVRVVCKVVAGVPDATRCEREGIVAAVG
jgi:hypothetical protein